MANPAADTDADGLPDAWETTHGLAPGSSADDDGALGDPDSDGLANLLEYATGLDPHARDASPLSLALAPPPTTGARPRVGTDRRRSHGSNARRRRAFSHAPGTPHDTTDLATPPPATATSSSPTAASSRPARSPSV